LQTQAAGKKSRCAFVAEELMRMSVMHTTVFIVLIAFFCVIAPAAIYVFAKCFTGRGWTFMDYNRDADPSHRRWGP
jgi:hypothetical protein